MVKASRNDIDRFCELVLKHRSATNMFSAASALYGYADRGALYITQQPSGVYMYADEGCFYSLLYVLTDMDAPPDFADISVPVVIEIAYRGETMPEAAKYLIKHGCKLMLTRARLRLDLIKANSTEKTDEPDMSSNEQNGQLAQNMQTGNNPKPSAEQVYELFREAFDQYTGCVPSVQELTKALAEDRLIAIMSDGVLHGALYHADSETASTINNVAAASDVQGKGIGSRLVAEWISKCTAAGKRVLNLWVNIENAPAMRLYEKNGFKHDGMNSVVLKYER